MSIAKKNNCKAVSISAESNLRIRLTNGQKMLLEFIKHKIETKQSINRVDMAILYINITCKDKVRVTNELKRNPTTGQYQYHRKEYKVNEHMHDMQALGFMWFKHNLGACIVKGKLVAIPVIEY